MPDGFALDASVLPSSELGRAALPPPETFAVSVSFPAPVATSPNRVSAPGDLLNPLENKAFSGDLESAQAERFGVFSPNLRILSKA